MSCVPFFVHTSVKDRIVDRQSASEVSSADAQDIRIEQGEKAGWLAPIALEPPRQRVRQKMTGRRASNKGCLSMSLEDYLRLVDWTGRQLHRKKRGQIPDDCAPILTRVQLSPDIWLDYVEHFRQRFRNEAGLPAMRQSYRERRSSTRTRIAT